MCSAAKIGYTLTKVMPNKVSVSRARLLALLAVAVAFGVALQRPSSARAAGELSDVDTSNSELRSLIERFSADRGNLLRFYNISGTPERRERLRRFYSDAKATLAEKQFRRGVAPPCPAGV